MPQHDEVIYWVSSVGPGDQKERVPMYFKGQLTSYTDEGHKGDVRGRPVSLGPGEYTAVYGRDDFETEDGKRIKFSRY